MDTKSEKMRALTCEATLVSLVIEDIFQDKADERTVNLLRLLAGRSEGVVWKEISLSELKARFAFYRDCFEDEVLALLQEFMNFTAALEADDMTDDFVIEAAPMLVAVGGLAKYIRDENLETAFIQAAFCWLLLCQQAVLSPEMSVRVIGALQVNGLAPIIVFRERENDEDELYRNMVLPVSLSKAAGCRIRKSENKKLQVINSLQFF